MYPSHLGLHHQFGPRRSKLEQVGIDYVAVTYMTGFPLKRFSICFYPTHGETERVQNANNQRQAVIKNFIKSRVSLSHRGW